MDFDEYQRQATQLDVSRDKEGRERPVIPLLGLAGEAGSLVSEFKKRYRDGDEGYPLFPERVREELGDILWYLSTVASRSGLSLAEIAQMNLEKNHAQFGGQSPALLSAFFDDDFPTWQQLPRKANYRIIEDQGVVRLFLDDWPYPIGQHLTDNAWTDDGYRFHDVFHLAYATILRWSPITRRILNCKRRRDAAIDEIEDGGRAGVIEEAVAAYIFEYAKGRNLLRDATVIDHDVLATIKQLVRPYEVRHCSTGEWQAAILKGFAVWNNVEAMKGGRIVCDAMQRSFDYAPL